MYTICGNIAVCRDVVGLFPKMVVGSELCKEGGRGGGGGCFQMTVGDIKGGGCFVFKDS